MEIDDLPFNRLLGLGMSSDPNRGLVRLDNDPRYRNQHAGVHVCAQFALAEAAGGCWLAEQLDDLPSGCDAFMRRAETRIRKPALGVLYARPQVLPETAQRVRDELARRGRSLVRVDVEVVDAAGAITLTAAFEWFLRSSTRDVEPAGAAAPSNGGRRL
jgi:acyl-coenzyme A thioesterase PaaI-like protein